MSRMDGNDSMRRAGRSWAAALLGAVLVAVLSSPAGAVPPETAEFEFSGVIEGVAEDCGVALRWEVGGTATRTTFFNDDGTVARFQDRVRETNTITNLDTGEVLQEGPDSFQQRILFNDDGTITQQINGLSVLVTGGDDLVIDAGRLVLLTGPDGTTIVALSGNHDLRAIDPTTTTDPILLNGFCPAFA